jgi:hypothetical protein
MPHYVLVWEIPTTTTGHSTSLGYTRLLCESVTVWVGFLRFGWARTQQQ